MLSCEQNRRNRKPNVRLASVYLWPSPPFRISTKRPSHRHGGRARGYFVGQLKATTIPTILASLTRLDGFDSVFAEQNDPGSTRRTLTSGQAYGSIMEKDDRCAGSYLPIITHYLPAVNPATQNVAQQSRHLSRSPAAVPCCPQAGSLRRASKRTRDPRAAGSECSICSRSLPWKAINSRTASEIPASSSSSTGWPGSR